LATLKGVGRLTEVKKNKKIKNRKAVIGTDFWLPNRDGRLIGGRVMGLRL